jgi:predicted acylesterase/phospholipase RssA
MSRPRVALVAGGGAVKAYAFHVGVLLGLEEDGFFFKSGLRWEPTSAPPDQREINVYIGSSAGACVVASLSGGHPIHHLRDAIRGRSKEVPTFGYGVLFVPIAPNPRRYVARLAKRFRLKRLRPHHLLDIGGVFTTAGVEKYFRKHVMPTSRFGDLGADLYIAATQVNSTRKVVFGPRDSLENGAYDTACAYYDNIPIPQAIAAAVAIPPLFAPYAIANPTTGKQFHYYDGEVRETSSMDIAREVGADFAIASSIWRPYQYNDKVGTLANLGATTLVEQALHQAVGQKVERDRKQSLQFEDLLKLIDRRLFAAGVDAKTAENLKQEVCMLLRHRRVQTLYVTPTQEDYPFFLDGSFRFNRRVIDRCIEAGLRAYRAAAGDHREFFSELDKWIS